MTEKKRSTEFNPKRRKFLLATTSIFTAIGAAFAAIPFLSAWWPSARAQALGAPIEVDLTQLQPGELITVEWRGRPVWILRRTEEMIQRLGLPNPNLRDAESYSDQQPEYAQNTYRSIRKEYLILIGICTHLGCTPAYRPNINELRDGWQGGFYCPCHGSTFDLAGRVYKGVPAPINLEVPPHHFVSDFKVVIGADA